MDYVWGGFVDISMNRAPDFGRLGDNLYYLQGFSGHGVALTGLAGQLVAEAVAGQAGRFDVFTRLKHREFPGGAIAAHTQPGAGHAVAPHEGCAGVVGTRRAAQRSGVFARRLALATALRCMGSRPF